jgi:hypothetical protein
VKPLTLREEHSFSVFKGRVLGRLSDPKAEEVTGEWKKLHKEELCGLHEI